MYVHRHLSGSMWHSSVSEHGEARKSLRTVNELPEVVDKANERSDDALMSGPWKISGGAEAKHQSP